MALKTRGKLIALAFATFGAAAALAFGTVAAADSGPDRPLLRVSSPQDQQSAGLQQAQETRQHPAPTPGTAPSATARNPVPRPPEICNAH